MSRSIQRDAVRAAVAAAALFAARPAAADPPKKDEATLNQLRVDLSGTYFRGTKMLGHGTRAPYQGGVGTLRFDARWFVARYVGFEGTAWYGLGHQSAEPGAGVQAALDVAPVRWSGPWGGGFILMAGGGLEVGKGNWLHQEVRGYPLVGARLVLWPAPRISTRLSWDFEPITTNTLRVRLHRVEAAFGWRWLQVGARFGISEAVGGEPSRTYGEIRGSLFFGAAFHG